MPSNQLHNHFACGALHRILLDECRILNFKDGMSVPIAAGEKLGKNDGGP
jgi:hypothetical protein